MLISLDALTQNAQDKNGRSRILQCKSYIECTEVLTVTSSWRSDDLRLDGRL